MQMGLLDHAFSRKVATETHGLIMRLLPVQPQAYLLGASHYEA
jgi:hypothetical protein